MNPDLKLYWQRLQPREQRLLQILGGILLLLVLYSLVLQPFNAARDELRQDVESRSELQQKVNAAVEQKQRLSGVGGSAQKARGKDLTQVIKLTVNQQQLAGALQSVSAQGKEKVSVQFADVSFIAINSWLQSLAQQYGLQVQSLQAKDKGHNGKVDINVSLGF